MWFSYTTCNFAGQVTASEIQKQLEPSEFGSSNEPMMRKRDDFILTCDLPELMPPARLLRVHQESGVAAEIDHAH